MKGIHIAAFMLCVVLASSVLGGMGWYANAGVSLDPGLDSQQKQVEEGLGDPSASSAGSDEFSLVRGAINTLDTLRILTTNADAALERMGVPTPIAGAIGIVVSFSMAIMFVQVIRGINIEA
jgi:hypothetical protein